MFKKEHVQAMTYAQFFKYQEYDERKRVIYIDEATLIIYRFVGYVKTILPNSVIKCLGDTSQKSFKIRTDSIGKQEWITALGTSVDIHMTKTYRFGEGIAKFLREFLNYEVYGNPEIRSEMIITDDTNVLKHSSEYTIIYWNRKSQAEFSSITNRKSEQLTLDTCQGISGDYVILALHHLTATDMADREGWILGLTRAKKKIIILTNKRIGLTDLLSKINFMYNLSNTHVTLRPTSKPSVWRAKEQDVDEIVKQVVIETIGCGLDVLSDFASMFTLSGLTKLMLGSTIDVAIYSQLKLVHSIYATIDLSDKNMFTVTCPIGISPSYEMKYIYSRKDIIDSIAKNDYELSKIMNALQVLVDVQEKSLMSFKQSNDHTKFDNTYKQVEMLQYNIETSMTRNALNVSTLTTINQCEEKLYSLEIDGRYTFSEALVGYCISITDSWTQFHVLVNSIGPLPFKWIKDTSSLSLSELLIRSKQAEMSKVQVYGAMLVARRGIMYLSNTDIHATNGLRKMYHGDVIDLVRRANMSKLVSSIITLNLKEIAENIHETSTFEVKLNADHVRSSLYALHDGCHNLITNHSGFNLINYLYNTNRPARLSNIETTKNTEQPEPYLNSIPFDNNSITYAINELGTNYNQFMVNIQYMAQCAEHTSCLEWNEKVLMQADIYPEKLDEWQGGHTYIFFHEVSRPYQVFTNKWNGDMKWSEKLKYVNKEMQDIRGCDIKLWEVTREVDKQEAIKLSNLVEDFNDLINIENLSIEWNYENLAEIDHFSTDLSPLLDLLESASSLSKNIVTFGATLKAFEVICFSIDWDRNPEICINENCIDIAIRVDGYKTETGFNYQNHAFYLKTIKPYKFKGMIDNLLHSGMYYNKRIIIIVCNELRDLKANLKDYFETEAYVTTIELYDDRYQI
jgi:hypothetical protein